jgi:hypothetical protein
VPASHHLAPAKIVAAVEKTLEQLAGRYRKRVIVYGDCGTAGALERIAARHGTVLLGGPHCYEIFAAGDFDSMVQEEPGTYFLTDFLVRSWETTVLPGLGLDRRPELREQHFSGFTRLVFLRQQTDPGLEEKARRIASFVDLPLEVRDVGLEGLEERLAPLLESPG